MNDNWQDIPPGQVWIPVEDEKAARIALIILLEHLRNFSGSAIEPDYDTV